MRSLIAILVLEALACGKVQEPEGNAQTDTGILSASDTQAEVETRSDGCAATPAQLTKPCELGKICEYDRECVFGWDRSIAVYTCQAPLDKPLGWYLSNRSCSSATRPDGCPYSSLPSDEIECKVEGKLCAYPSCSSPNAWENGIGQMRCQKSSSGGLRWHELPPTKCP